MYKVNTEFEYDSIENNLVAINVTTNKVVTFGEIEKKIFENIQNMTEKELIVLLKKEYADDGNLEVDVHEFIQSMISVGILLEKDKQ